MPQKVCKQIPSSITPSIEWHDEEKPLSRKKKKSKPTPSQRLATMSELAERLGKSNIQTTVADIEMLQNLARGLDIDIENLEI